MSQIEKLSENMNCESELKMKEPELYVDLTTGRYVNVPTEQTSKVDTNDYTTTLECLKAMIDKLDELQAFKDRQSVHN